MSNRISSNPAFPVIGQPGAKPGLATPVRPSASTLQGSTEGLSSRKRTAAMASDSPSTSPRASIDALHHHKRRAVSGLGKEAGSASLMVAQQALLDPGSPTTATVGKELWGHGSQHHKTGAKTLGTPTGSESGASPPAEAPDLANLAFKQHAVEPASGKTRHADKGKKYESASTHSRSRAHVGAWTRSVETAGIEALGREGLGINAAGFGEVGVGARGQTQFVKQHRLGRAAVQGSGGLSASAQGSGKVGADISGLNVQAGGQAQAGLKAESGVALRTREATLDLAGVRLDLTPNVDAKGRTSLGAEGGGSVFAGAVLPTAQERAAGTTFKAGLEASGSAFAGAKAEGDTSVGIGGNKIGLTGGVWAGAGAEGKANGSLTKVNGRTTARVELKAGAALGLGGALGVSAQVDVQPVVDAAQKVLKLGDAVARRLT